MSIHHLKIQRQPFEDLVSGRKTGEVRNCADREFREGDQVELFLIDETGNPANKSIVRTITHIQRGYGLPDDICVLSYAAPVVERQEAVAELKGLRFHANKAFEKVNKASTAYESGESALGLMEDIAESLLIIRNGLDAYASPPAPVAVLLPERKPRVAGYWYDLDLNDKIDDTFAKGWNACLDKVKEMNK